jgi:hypothetical protein
MKELRSIETNVLLDMLAARTSEYLRLSDEPGKETEYAKCVLTLRAIQSEIESRKQTAANTNTTDPNIIIQ